MNIRTDLAVEAVGVLKSKHKEYKKYGNLKVVETNVNKELAKKINKKEGDYYLIDISKEDINDSNNLLKVESLLTKILKQILKKENITNKSKGLIVGLGNLNITPDSLGPKVVDKIVVTRHLFEIDEKQVSDGVSNICAISPGVMGTTGIETSDIVKAIVDKIDLDYIIVVDALKASEITRVNKTIQITNSGISPGSGVGNKRKELSQDILGIPVIAIGVPTVVDAVTITSNTIEYLINFDKTQKALGNFGNLSLNEKKELIDMVLTPMGLNMIVATKEVDIEIENLSEIISGAINHSLHEINT
jgi:spore protease